MPAPHRAARPGAVAACSSLGAIASVQFGSAIADQAVRADRTRAARCGCASCSGRSSCWRCGGPGSARRTRAASWLLACLFGLVLGCMNLSFYSALHRIPLGIAVTLEFVGPLTVAVAGSRRPIDLLWVAIAAAGIIALTQGDTAASERARRRPSLCSPARCGALTSSSTPGWDGRSRAGPGWRSRCASRRS